MSLAPEFAERDTADEVRLSVEGVSDGCMRGDEFLD